jgi:hypothetical protein
MADRNKKDARKTSANIIRNSVEEAGREDAYSGVLGVELVAAAMLGTRRAYSWRAGE